MSGIGAETFVPVNSHLFWSILRKHKDTTRRTSFDTRQGAMDCGARKIGEGYIVTVGRFEGKWIVFYW